MSNPDRNSQKENKPRGGGNEPSFNWRGVVLIAIAFALIEFTRAKRLTSFIKSVRVEVSVFNNLGVF